MSGVSCWTPLMSVLRRIANGPTIASDRKWPGN
jgi:hypothetical protein